MTRRIAIIETVWYLAFQDGPAEGDKTYPTEALAKAELKRIRKSKGMGRDICVMDRTREVEP